MWLSDARKLSAIPCRAGAEMADRGNLVTDERCTGTRMHVCWPDESSELRRRTRCVNCTMLKPGKPVRTAPRLRWKHLRCHLLTYSSPAAKLIWKDISCLSRALWHLHWSLRVVEVLLRYPSAQELRL